MEIILGMIVSMLIVNTFILIAVAGSVSKMIGSFIPDEDDIEEKPKSSGTLVDFPAIGPPTYDVAVLNGKAEPFTDGMDRRLTPTRNWDGIS